MSQVTKQENPASRYRQEWFCDRYSEMKDPKFNQSEKTQEIFEHLVQRIVTLEKDVDALKVEGRRDLSKP
jgi:hypothetical protein